MHHDGDYVTTHVNITDYINTDPEVKNDIKNKFKNPGNKANKRKEKLQAIKEDNERFLIEIPSVDEIVTEPHPQT